jgi:alpha-beta hydrolase superfamily lysophospholipase
MRLLRLILAGLGLGLVAVGAVWWAARPVTPDAFYDAALPSSAPPGRLVAAEPLPQPVPEGARGWRILYTTQRHDGRPALASAVVVVPDGLRDAPVIAYAHGTTGIARGCAPSVFDDPFPNVPGFPELLAEGWAYVGTDYPGLGTPGGHAYLVGQDAAQAVLDSVRAARQLEEAALGSQTVVWGHSQGGHSALWTGQQAASYAPEVSLAGVAAVAPASDLPRLLLAGQGNPFGKIVSAYVVAAYAEAYPGLDPWADVRPGARLLARDMATRCVGPLPALVSVAAGALLPGAGIFADSIATSGFGAALAENVPRGPVAAPLLIAQGEADDLVSPAVQADYVAGLCEAGQPVDYRRYAGRDHITVVAPASPFVADLLAWTRARLAGAAPTPSCP